LDPQLFFLLAAEPRLFGLDFQTLVQIVVQLLNVSLLAYVLTRLLYKPVKKFLYDRTERIQDQIQFAEEEKTKASELRSEYELKVKEIAKEKDEILDAARKLAAEKSKEHLDAAREEAESVKTRALKEIEMERERAKDAMKQSIIDVSSMITAKFLAKNIDANVHEQLFKETIAELEEITWQS